MIKELFWKIISGFAPASEPAPVILMYHSIGHNKAQFTVTPEAFEDQMAFLKSSGRECLKLSEFAERLKSGTLPANAVAVTFDDGYADNFNEALPILKKSSIPATIFISTGFIGKGFTINNRFASAADDVITLQIMSESMIRELSNQGLVECMPHGHSHGILRDMSKEDAEKDILQSKQIIEGITGKPAVCFAYPYGKYSNETIEIITALGFQSAVTVKEGIVALRSDSSGFDPLLLPRMSVSRFVPLALFKLKISRPRRYLFLKEVARNMKI